METYNYLTAAGGLLGVVLRIIEQGLGLNIIALAFALLTPRLLLYGRSEIRLRRLRSIQDFARSFDTRPKEGGDSTRATTLASNPSFEFVKSKYLSDLDVPEPTNGEIPLADRSEVDQIDFIIRNLRGMGSTGNRRLFIASSGFMLLTYIGFAALTKTFQCGLSSGACETAGAIYGNSVQLAMIASLAFAGAYISAIRTFARAIAVFDLTPHTFLRQTAETIASVVFTIVLFALLRDPISAATALVTTPDTSNQHIQVIWFALAPLFGLLPQSATKFLMVKMQGQVPWVKVSDDSFIDVCKIVSPDIIDGIDYETRFRLEDCGIYDVQNLATYNPIMLHIESPFGIYQVFDWIAQAQLCHILGPEKFLIFREMNIRTIFDLERAISSRQAVDAFDEIASGILFASTRNLRKTMEISGTKLVTFDSNAVGEAGPKEFTEWARKRMESSGNKSSTEHVLRWIADDLHVRRLRRLWVDISASLGEDSWYLPDNADARAPEGPRLVVGNAH